MQRLQPVQSTHGIILKSSPSRPNIVTFPVGRMMERQSALKIIIEASNLLIVLYSANLLERDLESFGRENQY